MLGFAIYRQNRPNQTHAYRKGHVTLAEGDNNVLYMIWNWGSITLSVAFMLLFHLMSE